MKKILLLTMLFGMIGQLSATKKQTTVFKGEVASGEWSQTVSLDKGLFANAKSGDILYVKWTLDTEAALEKDGSAGSTYYQFDVSYPYGTWSDKLVASTDVKNTVNHYALTLTSEQVTKLKNYGIAIGGRFLKITDVVFGDAYSKTEVKYWGTDAWKSASTDNFVISSEWSSCVLNGDIIKTANIGDRLTVTITPNSSSLWDAQLQVIDASNSGWVELTGIPVGGLTSLSLLVDENIKEAFSRGDIRLNGVNLTITDIQLETTTLWYYLSAYNTNVDITKLPTTYTVNIELYRKYDWNTTICVPFDIADVTTAFELSAKAYEFAQKKDDSTLSFTEKSSIEAGKPYLMSCDMTGYNDVDKYITKSFDNVTINTTLTNSDEYNGLTFKGNYTKDMDMESKYGVACKQHNENWDWGFYKGASGSKLPIFSAYIEATSVLSSPRFSISTGGGTTGIDVFESVEEDNGPAYNLMGQQTMNPRKGIYIKNGKKYIAH